MAAYRANMFAHTTTLPRFKIFSLFFDTVRRISVTQGQHYAKKELPIRFEWPKRQLQIFNSGDTKELRQLDKSKPILKYQEIEDYVKEKSPVVQRLVSLAYAHRGEETKIHKIELRSLVKRHVLDKSSYEARIGYMTGKIRRQQEYLRGYILNSRARVSLKIAIDRRNKLLKELRRQDYKRFEWIVDVLGLTYRSPPMFQHWFTRKGTMRVMTREYCNKLRKDKIDAYRAKLKEMQNEFLKEKQETLMWAKMEKEKLKLDSEENDKSQCNN